MIHHTKVEVDADTNAITSVCKGNGNVPNADVGTYLADCEYCTTDFSFADPIATDAARDAMAEQRGYCLNYFVGHYQHTCAGLAAGDNACRNEFYYSACADNKWRDNHPGRVTPFADEAACIQEKNTHIDLMVNGAYKLSEKPDQGSVADEGEKASAFCSYTDEACKAKIRDTIESSMTVIGTVGLIFIIFFIAIMFLTLQGIKIYKGGGSDDDGDSDGDDDDSDE